jgi:hypothetical protein
MKTTYLTSAPKPNVGLAVGLAISPNSVGGEGGKGGAKTTKTKTEIEV